MLKKTRTNYFLIISIVVLLVFWGLYSVSFNQTYNEAEFFATEGAQPIVQILEILNYRGAELTPYFILFFTLTSLSFLVEIYLFLFLKKNKLKRTFLFLLSLVFLAILAINIMNKLYPFLLLLIVISSLVMLSIILTVKHLYMELEEDEEGTIIHTRGPFKSKDEAVMYSEKELDRLKEEGSDIHLYANSLIYSDDSNTYYVDIYLDADNDENKRGELE